MAKEDGVTRREFVTTATGAAVGALVAPQVAGAAVQAKRRYAIVGTGVRGNRHVGPADRRRFSDVVEFVGLCDINPLRVEVAKRQMGVDVPDLHELRRDARQGEADALMVTTVDAFHSEYIVNAMKRGIDVMTEKPMVIDETQCHAVLDAEKQPAGKRSSSRFNYRYAPKHQKIKELLMARRDRQDHRRSTSTGILDTSHGADYFRRWHRLRDKSGSLWVHKATHHFDLINWWLDGDPVEVSALGSLANYGKNSPFRHTNCRRVRTRTSAEFYWDINRSASNVAALRRLRVGRRLPA